MQQRITKHVESVGAKTNDSADIGVHFGRPGRVHHSMTHHTYRRVPPNEIVYAHTITVI